jgi:glycerophosphoryl diester phosphodiesterase
MRKPSSRNGAGRAGGSSAWPAIIGCVAVGAAVLTGCVAPGTPSAQGPASPQPASTDVAKVAHRGGAGLAPENTLAAFNAGLAHHADFLELDVHLSKDGQLVVIHDATLARTTNLSGEVADYTAAELAAADASAKFFGPVTVEPQPIPTLEQVLVLAKGRAGVQIEIKLRSDKSRYPGIEAKVVDALRAHEMLDEAVILSFDFPTLQEIKRIEPQLRTCALISTAYLSSEGRAGPAQVAEDIAALRAEYAGVNHTWLTDALIAALTGRGLQVGAWTVNDPADIRRLATLGVAFITSDRPDLLEEAFGP